MLDRVKELEHRGFQFEAANGSLELLMRKEAGDYEPLFRLESWRVLVEKRADGKVISSVIPLQFVIQESVVQAIVRFVSANWQWIAGTVVIPGLVFLLSKLGGKKPVPSEQPQQPAPKNTSATG